MTNDIDNKIRKLYKKIEKLEDLKVLQRKDEHIQSLERKLDQYKSFYSITKTIVSPECLSGIHEKLNRAGYNFPVK